MALIKTNARSASALDATILTGNLPALNGSAVTTINASNISSGTLAAARYSGGKIGQVVSAHKDDLHSFSSSSTDTFADLNVSLNITPTATSSKIFLISTVCISESTSATIHVRLLRDSTVINKIASLQSDQLTDMNSVRYQAATPYGNALYDVSNNYLDSPNTTSQITYKLQGTLGGSYSGTYYVNRTNDDVNNDFGARTPSNLTAMEILA